MAATMKNMELTGSVEILNSQFTDLNNRFNNAIPEMTNHITQSAAEIKAMYEAIKSDIQPLIDINFRLSNQVSKGHMQKPMMNTRNFRDLEKTRTRDAKTLELKSRRRRLLWKLRSIP